MGIPDSSLFFQGRYPGSQSLIAFSSPCEFSSRVPLRAAFARSGSLEVSRLHSTSGSTDSAWSRSTRLFRFPGFNPLSGLSPVEPSSQSEDQLERSRDFPFQAFPLLGAVPVSRPLLSCGSLVALQSPSVGPLQSFAPRKEFLEAWEMPPVACLGFAFRALSFSALAFGFFSRAILLRAFCLTTRRW